MILSSGCNDSCFLSFLISVPAKILHSKNVTIEEGKNASLVCIVEGNPPPRVAWIAPNENVKQNRTSDTDLSLPNVTRDMGGNYKCHVTNGLGNENEVIYLDVQCKWLVLTFSTFKSSIESLARCLFLIKLRRH